MRRWDLVALFAGVIFCAAGQRLIGGILIVIAIIKAVRD